jgi:hypothetical protein
MAQEDRAARERKARKKLSQICGLELRRDNGEELNEEQWAKLERKEHVLSELWELALDAYDIYEQVPFETCALVLFRNV